MRKLDLKHVQQKNQHLKIEKNGTLTIEFITKNELLKHYKKIIK